MFSNKNKGPYIIDLDELHNADERKNFRINKVKRLMKNRDKCVTELKYIEQELFDAKFEDEEENVNKRRYLKLIKKLDRLNIEIMDNLVDSYFFFVRIKWYVLL